MAITQLGGVTAQATTAGGSSFFSGAAVPVVLHPTDGYAYLTAGSTPSDLSQALRRQMAGGKGLASDHPRRDSPRLPPADANLMTVNLGEQSNLNGGGPLAVGMTDPTGKPIGGGSVSVPDGGWWVIGLGPGQNTIPERHRVQPRSGFVNGDPGSGGGPSAAGGDPGTDPGSGGNPGSGGGPVATPEPATALLAGLGGLGAFGWRLVRRRREVRPVRPRTLRGNSRLIS